MEKENIIDCLIIGAGPAGLTAAIYGQRSGLNTVILEKATPGGKMSKTSIIENYPGFSSIKGFEISLNMLNQATNLGSQYLYGEVKTIKKEDQIFVVTCNDGKEYKSKTVIIATGMIEREIGVSGEKEFYGKGVSYCAICDGALFKGKEIAVIGGGNSAVEESIFLSEIVSKIYLIHRGDNFRAEEKLIERVIKNDKIEIIKNNIVKSINGNKAVESITITNNNKDKTYNIAAVFIFIGFNPETKFINDDMVKIEDNFIIVNENMETNVPGLYSVGDVNKKKVRQISTAISDGTIAALMAKKFIDDNSK